jgi:hypothetical protein
MLELLFFTMEMGAYLTYLELSTGKDKRVIEFKIDVSCKCSRIPQMTAEKANLAKKIPSSPKKVLFSTSRIPLAVGALCLTFSATRGEPTPSTLTLVAEKSVTRPLQLRKIRA